MNKRIEGVITDKTPYSGTSTRAPAGTVFIGKDKYTCWKADIFSKLNVGSQVALDYTEQENTYEGRTFINRSIVSVDEETESKVDESDIRFSETEKEELAKVGMPTDVKGPLEGIPFQSEPFKVSGFTYRIVGTLELQ